MNSKTLLNLMFSVLITILSFLLFTNSALAETKTFVREYTFQAGDEDSKNSSRTISLREVKRLLLEELGTYLESTTEVQNFQLTFDQIITLTAGIVQTELVEEKWDGRTYWIKAKVQADSGDVIKAIDTLRKDRQKTKELEEVRKKSDALLKENERLRQELASSKGKKKQKNTAAYNKTIKDLNAFECFEKGYAAGTSGNWADAVAAYSKAIELNPQYAEAYNNRGIANDDMGNYNQSIKDYNKAIELNSQYAKAYNNRGVAYYNLGNYNQAIKDYNKAIELNPQYAEAFNNRGAAYNNRGNYNQAIKDYNKAIEFNPQYAEAYHNRGLTYYKLGNYNQAIKDYNKAIELNPQYAKAYNNRGVAYDELRNTNQAFHDFKIAARLGDKMAQENLREHGIAW
jgi:tetratricopeptide (TPR) repeat protein